MTFFTLISLLSIKNFLLVTDYNRKVFQVILLPSIYLALILVYPYVSDTKYYYYHFSTDIYYAEPGYIFLQLFLKEYFSVEIGFFFIMMAPLLVYLYLMKYSSVGVAYLLCSQLIVLLHLNGIRQGYAVALIYLGTILILDKRFLLGIPILMMAGLFHISALAVGLVILLRFFLMFINLGKILTYFLITIVSGLFIYNLSDIFNSLEIYEGYLLTREENAARTSPTVKYTLLFFYFMYFEYHLRHYYDEFRLLFDIRFTLFCVAIMPVLFLGLSEVSARIFIYVFAMEALLFFTLTWKAKVIKLSTKVLWSFFQVANPSVMGLLKLAM